MKKRISLELNHIVFPHTQTDRNTNETNYIETKKRYLYNKIYFKEQLHGVLDHMLPGRLGLRHWFQRLPMFLFHIFVNVLDVFRAEFKSIPHMFDDFACQSFYQCFKNDFFLFRLVKHL